MASFIICQTYDRGWEQRKRSMNPVFHTAALACLSREREREERIMKADQP